MAERTEYTKILLRDSRLAHRAELATSSQPEGHDPGEELVDVVVVVVGGGQHLVADAAHDRGGRESEPPAPVVDAGGEAVACPAASPAAARLADAVARARRAIRAQPGRERGGSVRREGRE